MGKVFIENRHGLSGQRRDVGAGAIAATPRPPGCRRPALSDRWPDYPARRLPAEPAARHRVEEVFAWAKASARKWKTKWRYRSGALPPSQPTALLT